VLLPSQNNGMFVLDNKQVLVADRPGAKAAHILKKNKQTKTSKRLRNDFINNCRFTKTMGELQSSISAG